MNDRTTSETSIIRLFDSTIERLGNFRAAVEQIGKDEDIRRTLEMLAASQQRESTKFKEALGLIRHFARHSEDPETRRALSHFEEYLYERHDSIEWKPGENP